MPLLVVEDDEALRQTLVAGLTAVGLPAEGAADGPTGFEQAASDRYDVIILDRMLPGLDGVELLVRLRRCGCRTPVLMLTARDAIADRVAGLDAGADDYLAKPFAVDELLARIRALLRRRAPPTAPEIVLGGLTFDTVGRRVRRDGVVLDITAREWELIDALLAQRGIEVDAATLAERLFGGGDHHNAIEALVTRLRRKLQPPGSEPVLHTRRGFGYRLG
jgi:two-component system response regulator MprA